MNIRLSDRIVSAISYCTFGMFSLIWLIFANFTKRSISNFLSFNLYQAIFISVALYIFSIIYSIAISLMSAIPFLGKLVQSVDIMLNQTPMYYNCSLMNFLLVLFLGYLTLMSLLGKKPVIPVISDMISCNFGG